MLAALGETRSGSSNQNRPFSIENVSFPLIVFPPFESTCSIPIQRPSRPWVPCFSPFWPALMNRQRLREQRTKCSRGIQGAKAGSLRRLFVTCRTWALLRWCFWRTGAPGHAVTRQHGRCYLWLGGEKLVHFLIQPHSDRDGLWPKVAPTSTGETWTVEKGQQRREEREAEMLLTWHKQFFSCKWILTFSRRGRGWTLILFCNSSGKERLWNQVWTSVWKFPSLVLQKCSINKMK